MTSNQPLLQTVGISKEFQSPEGPLEVFKDLDLCVQQKEFVSIVGPSGCGKTTLLLCLAGLMPVSSGSVTFKGQAVRAAPPGVAIVFQDYSRSLFPWKRNIENVIFGMRRLAGLSAKQRREAALQILETVGLSGFEHHYPWQVSGGMQQRVAIARALASRSELVLLDEPFASIDAQTRADMQDLVLNVFASLNQTCILVTHDIEEAIYVGTRVCVLSPRPSHIVLDVQTDLPFPRDQLQTREQSRFLELRHVVLKLIRKSRPKGN
jgi:NitT/TauT family transport system ATP-binding protein